MRRRDKAFAAVAWAALLGGLAWALSTQLHWVQSNKPLQTPKSAPAEVADPLPQPSSATGVMGPVSDDTRAAMAKGLGRRPPKPAPKPSSGPAPKPQP